MKKYAIAFVLLLVLSFSIFAEGQIPAGGRSCPNGQTTCLIAPSEIPQKTDEPIFKKVIDYLKSIFG